MLFVLLLAFPTTSQATIELVKESWGNIASVWGLLVSFYVLFVAKGARTAAQTERLRTALQNLEAAAEKCNQLGQFARAQKWELVQWRAREVEACCRATVARWDGDETLKNPRNKVLQVAALMSSIVEETDKANVNRNTILDAQRNSEGKLNTVVGTLQREQDSGSK